MKKGRITYKMLVGSILLLGLLGCKKEDETPLTEGLTPSPGITSPISETGPEDETNGYVFFTEAPMLTELTKNRALPAVEKRLPIKEDVMAAELPQIGTYGNEVQFATESASGLTKELVSEGLFCYGADETIVPNVAKAYTVTADYTQYTIYLREGMRWSDGVLFTADDCIFFYDKLCIPELFGDKLWSCFTTKSGKATFQKVDDYCFRVSFPEAKPDFLTQLIEQGGICFAAEHYFINLMPEFMGEDAANAKAKHMGYASVSEMLRETVKNAWNIPEVPTVNPYCISTEEGKKDVSGDYYEFIRNPYYWKIDTAGKQLPYMDCLGFTRISGESQKMLLTTEGFLSVSKLNPDQIAEARANAGRGGYRVVVWSDAVAFAVNTNLKNFPESYPYEERIRGIGAAHPESWFVE